MKVQTFMETPDIQRFELANQLIFRPHQPSGMIQGLVNTEYCQAAFFPYGAHLCHFQPTGQLHPVLFMSDQAFFQPGKPIRGGVPICFPWFSAHQQRPDLPAHGTVRTVTWQVSQTRVEAQAIVVVLELDADSYHLEYTLRFGSSLQMRLLVQNRSDQPQNYELALHTYLQLSHIDQVWITGLEGISFIDQLSQSTKPPSGQPIRFNGETDRIYQGLAAEVTLHDPGWQRTIRVCSRGSQSTVVWNPWIDKSNRMADFGDQEYLQMCCIESANVREQQVSLAAAELSCLEVELKIG
jgi:glucose-6-phosphate 1-epimerase